MLPFGGVADRARIESAGPYAGLDLPVTVHACLARTRARFPDRPALSFQMLSDPHAHAVTLSWEQLYRRVTGAANLFRALGIGPDDTVACLLPNCPEAAITLLAGATAGIVSPINPLLEADQIAALLRETGARVLVTLKPLARTDLAQKAARAVAMAPSVDHVLEVDLAPYLTGLAGIAARLVRPRRGRGRGAGRGAGRRHLRILSFAAEVARSPQAALSFADPLHDRIAARFHTGGTTGAPKIAQHRFSGMIYNGWAVSAVWIDESDVVLCPLPLFHAFAAYPVLMGCVVSGAHLVLPTPAGYRGPGVLDQFWKLIERWRATFLVGVPAAYAALMQRPVNADVSSLKIAASGSAPLPVALFHRFRDATGIGIVEGYGLTEATCLVSGNPPAGCKKPGSAGIAFPYTELRIIRFKDGCAVDCAPGETGEICISGPGVTAPTYMEAGRNAGTVIDGRWLRSGDVGRLDDDGYLWITGRSKDLIIRGGHNIDPAVIEESLLSHPAVACACAIGQPDPASGELPCAYVELVRGAGVSVDELLAHAASHVPERAAAPKYIEIMADLPTTAVGKTFRPALRAMAIARVLGDVLAGSGARVVGAPVDAAGDTLVRIARGPGCDAAAVAGRLAGLTVAWEWVDEAGGGEEGET